MSVLEVGDGREEQDCKFLSEKEFVLGSTGRKRERVGQGQKSRRM